jgi:hypothetical protein
VAPQARPRRKHGGTKTRALHFFEHHDEIIVHLAPVLIGDGVRSFGGLAYGRVDLERSSVVRSGQLTDLRFRAAK